MKSRASCRGCCDGVQLPKNRTVELWEGGAGAEIVYRLTQPPDRLCTQRNCRVYVEFDVELGDYPRCRSGKPIVQAVLADNTDTCHDTADNSDKTLPTDSEDRDDVIGSTSCGSRYPATSVSSSSSSSSIYLDKTKHKCLGHVGTYRHHGTIHDRVVIAVQ